MVVARGAKVLTFDMKKSPPREQLLAALLGPSGNLRAPAIVSGDTLIVGFSPAAVQSAGLG